LAAHQSSLCSGRAAGDTLPRRAAAWRGSCRERLPRGRPPAAPLQLLRRCPACRRRRRRRFRCCCHFQMPRLRCPPAPGRQPQLTSGPMAISAVLLLLAGAQSQTCGRHCLRGGGGGRRRRRRQWRRTQVSTGRCACLLAFLCPHLCGCRFPPAWPPAGTVRKERHANLTFGWRWGRWQ
jgi:hypothetical protein